MISRYERAELLAALWKLSAGEERIPTSHGILDRALKDTINDLPASLQEGLSFGVTGVGLRCFELPDILLAAQEAMLTSEPNPTYLSSIVTIDEGRAKQIAVTNGLSTAQAKEIGAKLLNAVHAIKSSMSSRRDEIAAA